MNKITDTRFIDYFEREFRKLDEIYQEHIDLETLLEKKI